MRGMTLAGEFFVGSVSAAYFTIVTLFLHGRTTFHEWDNSITLSMKEGTIQLVPSIMTTTIQVVVNLSYMICALSGRALFG